MRRARGHRLALGHGGVRREAGVQLDPVAAVGCRLAAVGGAVPGHRPLPGHPRHAAEQIAHRLVERAEDHQVDHRVHRQAEAEGLDLAAAVAVRGEGTRRRFERGDQRTGVDSTSGTRTSLLPTRSRPTRRRVCSPARPKVFQAARIWGSRFSRPPSIRPRSRGRGRPNSTAQSWRFGSSTEPTTSTINGRGWRRSGSRSPAPAACRPPRCRPRHGPGRPAVGEGDHHLVLAVRHHRVAIVAPVQHHLAEVEVGEPSG